MSLRNRFAPRSQTGDPPSTPPPVSPGSGEASLADRVQAAFAAAAHLVGRMAAVTVLGAVGTVAITRLLGPNDYGSYAWAIAAAGLLGKAADFGFGPMLGRDAAGSPELHRPMLRAAYEVASMWSLALTAVLVGVAVATGLDTDRGVALLVLAPMMACNGLNPAREFMIITRRTALLAKIDVALVALQLGAGIALAAAGLGPVAVVATVSASSVVENLIVAAIMARALGPAPSGRYSRRQVVRRSAPLGLASVLTQVYVTIDVVLLGWLIRGPRLGQYAAAAKLVTVLGGVAGVVMSGVLPTLAASAARPGELRALVARTWHWLLVGPVAVFVGVGVFARPLLVAALGRRYAPAAPMLEILSGAGCVGVLVNLASNLQIVLARNRALVAQSAVAIGLNVTGNLILIPRLGPVAAAWMTLATELLVGTWALLSARAAIGFPGLLGVSARPLVALAAGTAVALALPGDAGVTALAAVAAFLASLTLLRGWPDELRLGRSSRPLA